MRNFPAIYCPTPKPTVVGNIFEIRADRSIRATGGRYASNLDTNFVSFLLRFLIATGAVAQSSKQVVFANSHPATPVISLIRTQTLKTNILGFGFGVKVNPVIHTKAPAMEQCASMVLT